MVFIVEEFRKKRNEKLHIAFVPPCDDCYVAFKNDPYPNGDDDGLKNMAYYLEWNSKSQSYRSCFGYFIFWGKNGGRNVVSPNGLFKRGGNKRDYDNFSVKNFGNGRTALLEHQYNVHFDVKIIDEMLENVGALPSVAKNWSYWEE